MGAGPRDGFKVKRLEATATGTVAEERPERKVMLCAGPAPSVNARANAPRGPRSIERMRHVIDQVRDELSRASPHASAEISDSELQAMIGECRGRLDQPTLRAITDCVVAHAIAIAAERGNWSSAGRRRKGRR